MNTNCETLRFLQDFGLTNGNISEPVAVDLLYDLLFALNQLHRVGLIHRDIKPDNFIVYQESTTRKYHLKLIDLGLAEKISHNAYRMVGTPQYMSPEALKGYHSPQSDLFSACKSIFVLMGCPNYNYDDETQSLISTDFHSLLLKLTEVRPDRRGTIAEALLALKRLQLRYFKPPVDEHTLNPAFPAKKCLPEKLNLQAIMNDTNITDSTDFRLTSRESSLDSEFGDEFNNATSHSVHIPPPPVEVMAKKDNKKSMFNIVGYLFDNFVI